MAAAIEAFGSVDLLVNNTGINPAFGPLMELDLDAARKIMDVNVVAALGFTQEAYRAWMKEHGGAVVNISSVSGRAPGAVHLDVRRQQGRADQPDRDPRRGAQPRHPGQRGRTRRS